MSVHFYSNMTPLKIYLYFPVVMMNISPKLLVAFINALLMQKNQYPR